jgi:hypothetical protein
MIYQIGSWTGIGVFARNSGPAAVILSAYRGNCDVWQ